jgi:hypothetical protein
MSNIGPVGGPQDPSHAHLPNTPLAKARADIDNLQNAINQLESDETSGNTGAVAQDQKNIESLMKQLRTDMNAMPNQNSPVMKALNEQYNAMSDAYLQFTQSPSQQSLNYLQGCTDLVSSTLHKMW